MRPRARPLPAAWLDGAEHQVPDASRRLAELALALQRCAPGLAQAALGGAEFVESDVAHILAGLRGAKKFVEVGARLPARCPYRAEHLDGFDGLVGLGARARRHASGRLPADHRGHLPERARSSFDCSGAAAARRSWIKGSLIEWARTGQRAHRSPGVIHVRSRGGRAAAKADSASSAVPARWMSFLLAGLSSPTATMRSS